MEKDRFENDIPKLTGHRNSLDTEIHNLRLTELVRLRKRLLSALNKCKYINNNSSILMKMLIETCLKYITIFFFFSAANDYLTTSGLLHLQEASVARVVSCSIVL